MTELDGGRAGPPGRGLPGHRPRSLMGARGNSGVILCQLLRGLTGAGRGRGGGVGPDAPRGASPPASGPPGRAATGRGHDPHRGRRRRRRGAAQRPRPGRASRGAARRGGRGPGPYARAAARPGPGRRGRRRRAGYLLLLDAFLLVLDGRPLPPPRASPRRTSAARRPGRERRRRRRRGARGRATCATRSCTSSRRPTTPSGLQGGVGRHRRLHRGGGRRRPVELPHPHQRRGRLDRGRRSTRGGRRDIRVTDLADQVEEERWVRERVGLPAPGPARHRAAATHGRGGGGQRRGHRPHLPLARRAPPRGRGASHEPVDGAILGGRRVGPLRPGGAAAQQRQHPPRGHAGGRAGHQDGARGADERDRRGVRRAARVRPGGGAADNAAAMAESARRVVAGEVTRAVRDAGTGGRVHAGDCMGLSRDGVGRSSGIGGRAPAGSSSLLLYDDSRARHFIEGEGSGVARPGV